MNDYCHRPVQKNETGGGDPLLSRRTFLQLGAGALIAWLTGCRRTGVAPATTSPPSPTATASATSSPSPLPASTATSTAMPTTIPTATYPPPTPTATPIPPTYTPVTVTPTSPPPTTTPGPAPTLNRATLMAHWPTTETSRVVVVRHSGVWTGDAPDPDIVFQMLDAGLSALTDVSDPLAVWRTLFEPGEHVLLKVNCIASGGPTQPVVTYAVARRLKDAGLPGENILIFDRRDHELVTAGYKLNEGEPGIQCHGSRGEGTEAVLTQATVRLYKELDDCDAIINIPTPKQHGGAGVSVSLKNHYGSVDRPGALHGDWCDPAIAELNARPTVRDKTRLVVGAALNVSPLGWEQPERENALLLSFDPVALDTVARDILVRHRQERGQHAGFLIDGARHLSTAQTLSLGATEASLIDLREVTLG
ncbi:MAG: DUF362 domain-containing protein [Chloroflexota bacterium]|nr:DUF362 domain-containing protein [Chloroflexota bacterium]